MHFYVPLFRNMLYVEIVIAAAGPSGVEIPVVTFLLCAINQDTAHIEDSVTDKGTY
jgi:hypothetical protein